MWLFCAAHCHLFLIDEDFVRLRSLAFSDSVDPFTISSLCKKLFTKQRKSDLKSEKGVGHLVGLKAEELETELDVRTEVISTILAYLESEGRSFLPPLTMTISMNCLSTHRSSTGFIRLVSEKCPITAKISFFDTPGALATHNKLMHAVLDHSTYSLLPFHFVGSYLVFSAGDAA